MTNLFILTLVATLALVAAVALLTMAAMAQESGPATAPARDAARVSPSRPPDRTIIYKKVAQHQVTSTGELRLYAYLPSDWKPTDRRPAIVFFFGGGWEMGTPEQFYSKAEYLAARGMVAFSAEYRVRSRNRSTIEQSVEDARSAMRYVRSHASEWGVDADKLVSAGGSAGGHLAAAVALMDGPDDPADDMKVSCKPQVMILFNPPLDMDCLFREERLTKLAMSDIVSGNSEQEKKQALKGLSPIEYVQKGCPPMLVLFGSNDGFLQDARALARKSLPLGNRVEIWVAPRIGHGFFNGPPWHQATLIKADEFLSSLGYLQGPPTIKPADEKAELAQEAVGG